MNSQAIAELESTLIVQEKQDRLLRLLRSKKANIGLNDLYYFDKYILNYREMEEQPHRGLCDFVMKPGSLFQLILEPRGCFKTSCITVGYSTHSIIRNPNIRILIDTEDVSISKTFLREIKDHFENNSEVRKFFGDFVGNKWTEHEIIVSKRTKTHLKEPTIALAGIETTRVGQHYDLIICDDLHSQQNVSTPEQIVKVKKHFKLLFSLLDPGGQMIVIGTRWHFDDLYGEIIEKEMERRAAGKPKRFRIRRKKAIKEDGTLHFPTRLTREFLDDVKMEQGSYIFSCQYQNEPVDQDSAKFKKVWIKYYGTTAPQGLFITSVLDPAISKKDDGCYSAITTIGSDYDGYWFILDVLRMKLNPTEVVNAIFTTQQKWNPVRFGIEVVAYQKSLKYWVKERSMDGGVFPNIVELRTDTTITKPMRIEGLIPRVEYGMILFPGFGESTIPKHIYPLYEEMVQFPVGKYIDALDSLAYHLQLTIKPNKKVKIIQPGPDTIYALLKKHRRMVSGKKSYGIPVLGHDRIRSAEPEGIKVRIP